MKRKSLALILTSVLILLSSTLTVYAEAEIELSISGGKSMYAGTSKLFYGGGSRFLLSNESFYVDIQGFLAKKGHLSDIEDFYKAYLGVDIGTSLKCFAANLAYSFYTENRKLFPYGQPEDTIISEKWTRDEITGGLGLNFGSYTKSFIQITGLAGYSWYRDKVDLKFVDLVMDNESKSPVIGGNIKGRLDFTLKNTNSFFTARIWLDFQGSYNYYSEDKEYKAKAMLGLGIQFIKHLGIKASTTFTRRMYNYDKEVKLVSSCVGLVLIF